MTKNRLLLRQIKKHLGADAPVPPALAGLLEVVEETYDQYDRDRQLVDRAMRLSSEELMAANDNLRAQNLRNAEVIGRLRTLVDSLRADAPQNRLDGDDPGDVLQLSSIMEELILRRNEAELKLRAALVKAEEASRAKSDFLAVMSHEIRTPMNAVIGFTELLLESGLDPRQRKYAETLKRSGESLLVLINDILDFSKIEAGKLALELGPCNVELVVHEVVTLVSKGAADKGIAVELKFAGDAPPIALADPSRLRQVLINLAGNAVKFTATGKVTVEVSRRTGAPCGPAGSPGKAGDNQVLFRVVDTGIGISEEKQKLLFQKFSQVDASATRKFGGTGLGLAISKSLVEMMGGEIGVVSREGEGSTFWFSLPATLASPARTASSPAPAPTAAVREAAPARRALVVDDNEINLIVAEEFLKELGCTAECVSSAADALTKLKAVRYDLIFMDCRMPVMDGFAATSAIRALEGPAGRHPIIALTANASGSDRDECLAAGMDDFISKPIQKGELKRLLSRWAPRPA